MSDTYSRESPTAPLTTFSAGAAANPACAGGASGYSSASAGSTFCAPYLTDSAVVPECVGGGGGGGGGSPVLANLILWLEADSNVITQNLEFKGVAI